MKLVDHVVEKQVVGMELVCNALKENEKTDGIDPDTLPEGAGSILEGTVDEATETVSSIRSKWKGQPRSHRSEWYKWVRLMKWEYSESDSKDEEHLIRQNEGIKARITRPDPYLLAKKKSREG
jgi:hypothetical protein